MISRQNHKTATLLAFLLGCAVASFAELLIQNLFGLEKYSEVIHAYWITTSWAVWGGLSILVLIGQLCLMRQIKFVGFKKSGLYSPHLRGSKLDWLCKALSFNKLSLIKLSIVLGYCFQTTVFNMFLELFGRSNYLAIVQSYWIDAHWIICIAFFIVAGESYTRIIKPFE